MSASPAADAPPTITLTVELKLDQAAALARLCDKFHYGDADQYLYGHVAKNIRTEQSYQMVYALAAIEKALLKAGIRGWPWVETGSAG